MIIVFSILCLLHICLLFLPRIVHQKVLETDYALSISHASTCRFFVHLGTSKKSLDGYSDKDHAVVVSKSLSYSWTLRHSLIQSLKGCEFTQEFLARSTSAAYATIILYHAIPCPYSQSKQTLSPVNAHVNPTRNDPMHAPQKAPPPNI